MICLEIILILLLLLFYEFYISLKLQILPCFTLGSSVIVQKSQSIIDKKIVPISDFGMHSKWERMNDFHTRHLHPVFIVMAACAKRRCAPKKRSMVGFLGE